MGWGMRAMLRRLAADDRGVSLVEFAIAFPVLLGMYLGSYVVCDAIGANRKVSSAARELTDITSRFVSLNNADVTSILNASAQVMSPYSAANAQIKLSQVQVCTATTGKVIWGRGTTNTTARAVGSVVTLPANMVHATMIPAAGCLAALDASGTFGTGGYLVFGEVQYNYRPPVAYGTFTQMTLFDKTYMSPRVSNSVPLIP